MRVTLESTDKLIELETPTGRVPARIWEGQTASGIPCHAFVTRIAVHKDLDTSEFDRELQAHRAPSAAIANTYDSRLVL